MNTNRETNFVQGVLESDIPVLVDFWAPWCGPCKQVGPVLDAIVKELEGKLKLSKINVDDNPTLASTYKVKAIPTMILFVGGQEQARLVGSVPKADIVKLIDEHLKLKLA